MIEVISYKSINGLEFGASPKRVIEVFGEPRLKRNDRGYVEYAFEQYRVIFDKNNNFSEFLLYPRTKATLNGIPIAWTLKEILPIIKSDNNTIISSDDYGIILPKYGMYIGAYHISDDDDDSDKSIEFLANDVMDEYLIEEIEENAKPFNLDELKKEIKNSNLEIDIP
jgi:hypothetical protein